MGMIKNSDAEQIERLNSRIVELLRERDALREALGQIAGKNDLSGISDENLKSATFNALHECELIARDALEAPLIGESKEVKW